MHRRDWLYMVTWMALAGCGSGPEVNGEPPIKKAPALAQADAKKGNDGKGAADANSYQVKFETTQGDFVVLVHRDWAPVGADRFEELVKADFYNDCKFFRVVRTPNPFMVQFGISGDPAVMAEWRDKKIKDDPVRKSNKKGYITFATSGPNSRTTQVFINYTNNTFLDDQGFSPFGEVVSGMDVVEKLYAEYGERPSKAQPQIQSGGNKFLDASFPKLDGIKKAYVVEKK